MRVNMPLVDLRRIPYILTRNGIVIDAGEAFFQLTEYTDEEILQKTTHEVFYSLLRISDSIWDLKSVKTGECFYAFTKSYEAIEVGISILDSSNEGERYYIIFEKSSLSMDKDMSFLGKLFNDNHYGIAIFSCPDLILLKRNQKYSSYMGDPFDKNEECIGLSMNQLVPDFKGSESENRWTNIIQTGETVYLEEFNQGIGNMKGKCWENTIIPITINGKVKFIISMLVDVTEKVEAKKRIERQSRVIAQQNKQLEAIIESIDDYISIIDKNGVYLKINNAQREMVRPHSKFDIHDFISEAEYCEFDGSEIPLEELPTLKVLSGHKVKSRRILVRKNGKERYYDISGAPILGDDGALSMGVVMHHDITELVNKSKLIQKQKEELLKSERERNEALEKAIEVKDEFLSLISHEFRTPLNVINTAIQAMELICGNELSDTAKSFVQSIRQNCFRQIRLVNNLLDITRSNAGHIKTHKKNMDIILLTKAITESVCVYASQKGISLTFISEIEQKIICVDDEKYERILLNLLSNAIKFTPSGKSIIVTVSLKKGNICVDVKDHGIGIPKDKLDIIFERFGQVDSSLSRQAEGTGIGLSLVKRFVEALGGRISVKSTVNKGSTFTILIPDQMNLEENSEKPTYHLLDNHLVQNTTIEFSDIYL